MWKGTVQCEELVTRIRKSKLRTERHLVEVRELNSKLVEEGRESDKFAYFSMWRSLKQSAWVVVDHWRVVKRNH